MEVILHKVRLNSNISGVTISSMEHKLAAFADDVLFFIGDLQEALPNLLGELEQLKSLVQL